MEYDGVWDVSSICSISHLSAAAKAHGGGCCHVCRRLDLLYLSEGRANFGWKPKESTEKAFQLSLRSLKTFIGFVTMTYIPCITIHTNTHTHTPTQDGWPTYQPLPATFLRSSPLHLGWPTRRAWVTNQGQKPVKAVKSTRRDLHCLYDGVSFLLHFTSTIDNSNAHEFLQCQGPHSLAL